MKQHWRPACDARRIGAHLVAAAGAVALVGCSSQVSGDLSVESLGKSGNAVIMMAAVLDSDHERSCVSAGFVPIGGARQVAFAQLPGKRMYPLTLKLGTGMLPDAGQEIVGSMEIAPGTYAVDGVTCGPVGGGGVQVVSSSSAGFATFSVAAGEVVNLGKLVVINVPAARVVYVAHTAPLRTDPRKQLNKELAARLVDRPLKLSQPPLPREELARICTLQRAKPNLAIVPISPPIVCELAGI